MRFFKTRIKEYRAKYSLKQDDLAKLVGVRRETIGNIENGRYIVDPFVKTANQNY